MSLKYKIIKEYLLQFLKEETFKTGLNGGVLLADERVDVFVTVLLAKEAFGNRFLIVTTPWLSEETKRAIGDFCDRYTIRQHQLEAGEMPALEGRNKAFLKRLSTAYLYDIAERERALVLGAHNKTRLLLGEGVHYGDLACDLNPVGDLYLTEVEAFADYLGVDNLFVKTSRFGGYGAEALDGALRGFVEARMSRDELLRQGYDAEMVDTIIERVYRNQYKYRPPIIAKLTSRTIGDDLRYPRDIKL